MQHRYTRWLEQTDISKWEAFQPLLRFDEEISHRANEMNLAWGILHRLHVIANEVHLTRHLGYRKLVASKL